MKPSSGEKPCSQGWNFSPRKPSPSTQRRTSCANAPGDIERCLDALDGADLALSVYESGVHPAFSLVELDPDGAAHLCSPAVAVQDGPLAVAEGVAEHRRVVAAYDEPHELRTARGTVTAVEPTDRYESEVTRVGSRYPRRDETNRIVAVHYTFAVIGSMSMFFGPLFFVPGLGGLATGVAHHPDVGALRHRLALQLLLQGVGGVGTRTDGHEAELGARRQPDLEQRRPQRELRLRLRRRELCARGRLDAGKRPRIAKRPHAPAPRGAGPTA